MVNLNTYKQKKKELGLTFDQLSKMSGVPLQTLHNIFRGHTQNPRIDTMLLIPFKKAERNNRRALTNDELKKLFERLNLPEFKDYKQTFLILLFFGLRPCELEDARFEDDFLISRNAKRKGGKIEYKKIPISERIQGKINFSIDFSKTASVAVLEKKFNLIFG